MTQFEDVLETILEEYARRDSEGEFDTWEETDAFVKKKAEVLLAYVKEEPIGEDLEKIVEEIAEPTILNAYGTKELARRLRNTICSTSVSEDLEEAMQHNAPDNIGIDDLLYWRNGFIAGAKWKKDQNK